jgi:hypothetical protein
MSPKYNFPSEFPLYSTDELPKVSFEELVEIVIDMKNFIKLDIPDDYIREQNIHHMRAYYRHYMDMLEQYL